jgi:hypothetical protein
MMPASESNVLDIVKLRLGISDDSKDALIDSYVQEIGQRIRHYCNLPEIPDGLAHTWASMVVDAVRVDQPQDEQIAATVGGGESIKIGDTSMTSGGSGGGLSNTGKSVIDQVVLNYRVDLNRYRRMRW